MLLFLSFMQLCNNSYNHISYNSTHTNSLKNSINSFKLQLTIILFYIWQNGKFHDFRIYWDALWPFEWYLFLTIKSFFFFSPPPIHIAAGRGEPLPVFTCVGLIIRLKVCSVHWFFPPTTWLLQFPVSWPLFNYNIKLQHVHSWATRLVVCNHILGASRISLIHFLQCLFKKV